RRLVNLAPKNGIIIANGDDADVIDVTSKSFAPVETFGFSEDCTWQASQMSYDTNTSHFDLSFKGKKEISLTINLLGEFNIRNAMAVAIAARHHGISNE